MSSSKGGDVGVSRVKVCGITRVEDARLALDLGAWAIGFVFHPSSPRAIEPDSARAIVAALPAGALAIGVFVDRPASEVLRVTEFVGLRGVQLHGSEGASEVVELRREARAEPLTIIKAFRVRDDFDTTRIEAYDCDHVLLDTYRRDRPGGTGETFDWRVARDVAERRSTIVAGGLGPENAREAIAAAAPFAIDVSSRLETRPGVKDSERVRALFAAVGRVGGAS